MIYAVPQTDQTSEPAMAALVARLRLTAPKPDAIAATGSPNISDATIALHLTKAIGEITSALGDTATPPLLQWDGALDGVCIDLATVRIFNTRGRNRQAGADASLDAVGDDARAYLARCRPGSPTGKSENPFFIDSGSNVARDAPSIKSSGRSDDFIKLREGRPYR